jgi:uroporphyrinogen-III synthase
VAYRTMRSSDAGQERLARVAKGEVDAILFFSPSAVHSFVELAGSQPLILLQNRVAMAAVGPVTAGALREIGVQRIVQAPEATAGAVVGALEEYFASREELKAGVRRT